MTDSRSRHPGRLPSAWRRWRLGAALLAVALATVGCVGSTPEDRARTDLLADDPIFDERDPLPSWDSYRHRDKEAGGTAETASPINSVGSSFDLPSDVDLAAELAAMVPVLEDAGWSKLVATCDNLDGERFPGGRIIGLKDYGDFQATIRVSVMRIVWKDEVIGSISVWADLVAFTDPPEYQSQDLSCLGL